MGDPKKFKKKYDSPRRPWDKNRIVAENSLVEKYGLTNKKEINIVKTLLNSKRASARKILSLKSDLVASETKKLIGSLSKYGLLTNDATVENILSLRVEDFLERRLETIVFRRGLATTPKQARQFIVHGFIEVNGKRCKSPSMLLLKKDDDTVRYYMNKKPKILDIKVDAPELQKKKIENPEENNDNVENKE